MHQTTPWRELKLRKFPSLPLIIYLGRIPNYYYIHLIGASKLRATVTMTSVPNTQKMSYTKRPESSRVPVWTLLRLSSSMPLMANASPSKLLAIQCCKVYTKRLLALLYQIYTLILFLTKPAKIALGVISHSNCVTYFFAQKVIVISYTENKNGHYITFSFNNVKITYIYNMKVIEYSAGVPFKILQIPHFFKTHYYAYFS